MVSNYNHPYLIQNQDDKLEPIQLDPIIVKGSPAWDTLCKTSN